MIQENQNVTLHKANTHRTVGYNQYKGLDTAYFTVWYWCLTLGVKAAYERAVVAARQLPVTKTTSRCTSPSKIQSETRKIVRTW